MTPYAPPLTDMRFTLNDVIRLENLTRLPGFEAVEASLSDQILEEAGKFSSNVLAPRILREIGAVQRLKMVSYDQQVDLAKHITNGQKQDGIPFLLIKHMVVKDYLGRLPPQFGRCGSHRIWPSHYALY